ncbi:hypothetical protein V8E36_008963 [Tilletia maclaganii]
MQPRLYGPATGANAIVLPSQKRRPEPGRPTINPNTPRSAPSIAPATSGTYADYFCSSSAAARRNRDPVRITISKGAHYTVDQRTGLPIYEEIWEEEEIKDDCAAGGTQELNPQITETVSQDGGRSPLANVSNGASHHDRSYRTRAPDDEAMLPAPHGRELDAKAEDSHKLIKSSSFTSIQQKTTKLYATAGPSLMVLDTNTLLRSFVFLRNLCSLLLVRNLNALLLRAVWPATAPITTRDVPLDFKPAPFRLVVPHIVIRELDGLKSGGRSQELRDEARQVNRWILACLQAQKRAATTFLNDKSTGLILNAALAAGATHAQVAASAEAVMAAPIPPDAWALHFETSRQYEERNAAKGRDARGSGLSNDQLIVDLCVDLAATTSLPVWLLSNDTNARTHAEIEGIRALELEVIVHEPDKPSTAIKSTRSDDPWSKASGGDSEANGDGVRWSGSKPRKKLSDPMVAARELIEQWDAQVEGYAEAPSSLPSAGGPLLSPSIDADGDESMSI